jgi:hypothetical protein
MNIFILNQNFTQKGESVLWMSAFLVEQNYQSWRETDVSAGSAGIRQRKPIQKTSNLRSKQFGIVVEILITSY